MRRLRPVVLVALVVLASTSATAVPSGGDLHSVPSPDEPAQREDPVGIEYTYFLTPDDPGTIRVSATFRLPDDVSRLEVTVPDGSTVASRRGFEAGNGSGAFQWTREGDATTPRLTYQRPVNEKVDRFAINLFRYYDAGDWALSNYFRHDLQFRYWYDNDDPEWRVTRTADEGVVGNSMMLLGPTETATRTVRSQRIHVVENRGEPLDVREALDTLAYLSGNLRVGDRDRSLYVFVAPTPMHPGTSDGEYRLDQSGESVQGDVFVRSDVTVREGPENTWIHEYVHTRLGFESTRRMAWINEGIPEYYDAFFAYHRFETDFGEFREHISSEEYAEANLLEPDSWSRPEVEYVKGSRVIAGLDAKVRAETDGQRTFQHVLRRMNDHEGNLSYADFERIVGDVAGTDLSGWLDRYVAGSAAPEVPDDPDSYQLDPPAEFASVPATPTRTATATQTAEPSASPTQTTADTDAETPASVDATPTPEADGARTTARSTPAPTSTRAVSDGGSNTGASAPGFGPLVTLVALAVFALRTRR